MILINPIADFCNIFISGDELNIAMKNSQIVRLDRKNVFHKFVKIKLNDDDFYFTEYDYFELFNKKINNEALYRLDYFTGHDGIKLTTLIIYWNNWDEETLKSTIEGFNIIGTSITLVNNNLFKLLNEPGNKKLWEKNIMTMIELIKEKEESKW